MKTKRPYKKRGPKPKDDLNIMPALDEKTASVEAIVSDIAALIRESHEIYRGVFLYLRRELIKSVGKVRDLKKEFEAKAAAEASLAMEGR